MKMKSITVLLFTWILIVGNLSAQVDTRQTYAIQAKSSGMVWDVRGASQSNEGPIDQYSFHGGPNQRWKFQHLGGGEYYIINENSGKAAAILYASGEDGAKLIQYDITGTPNQVFRMVDRGSGYYQIIVKHTGKAIDLHVGTSEVVQLQQWGSHGRDNQLFKLIPLNERLDVNNTNAVRYGQTYHLLNGYANWNGGYLDAYGNAAYHLNQWDVSTSRSSNRDNGTGTWKILSAEGKAEGSLVMHGDKIRLYNMYQNNGGYLDVCNKVSCEGENYGIMTSRSGDRDGNRTSTWVIEAEAPGTIELGEVLHFRTMYNNHWLQTCGVQPGNLYDANTFPQRERRELVTQWKMFKAQ